MRKRVVLLAAMVTALLLTSGVALAQEADTTPPETTLSSWQHPRPYDNSSSATFGISSNEANSTFECKLDGGSFEVCASPKNYYPLSEGQHIFQVQAKDAAGNIDPTPAEYTWVVDLSDPTMTWTERPGQNVVNSDWVTNDNTPTWGYAFSDENLGEADPTCTLYNRTLSEYIVIFQSCPSPTTFPFELVDGKYYFDVWYEDKAYNVGYYYQSLEVDTVAPNIATTKPAGRRVSRYAEVMVTFDDNVYKSAKFVNIYKRGSSTPLAVSRSTYGKQITLDPNNSLRRDTWYTVKVTTGVNDGANNLETPRTWSFKTK